MNTYSLLAEQRDTVPMRISLREVTGTINSAILFQQACFNLNRSSREGCFWKFNTPRPDNPRYKLGDSWEEETGLSRSQFESARKIIATEAKTRGEIQDFLKRDEMNYCFVYYNDAYNITWWYYNEKAGNKVIEASAKISRAKALAIAESKGLDNLVDPLNAEIKPASSMQETSIPYNPENTTKNNSTRGNKVFEAKEPSVVKSPKQKTFDSRFKNGFKMPEDFDIDAEFISEIVEMGYDARDVMEEKIKYIDYYKNGDGKKKIHWNWNQNFVYGWLDRGYKKGYLKRDGQFYTTSANQERLDKLRKHSQPLFNDPNGDYSIDSIF